MADYGKVSELDAAASVAATDLLEISQDQGGGSYLSKKVPFSGLAGSVGVRGGAGLTVDGGGLTLTVGSKGYVTIPYGGTITDWSLAADQTGSIVFDVKRSGSSIVGAGNKPTLASAQFGSANVAGWGSVAIAKGDVLEFLVDSVASVGWVNLVIGIRKD